MSQQILTASDVRQDFEPLLGALAEIERHYPEHTIRLIPKEMAERPDGIRLRPARRKTIRATVIAALSDWKSVSVLIAETGLTRRQILGVLVATDKSDDFERESRDGRKLFRLKPKSK